MTPNAVALYALLTLFVTTLPVLFKLLIEILKIQRATHVLVNSAFGVLLGKNLTKSERIFGFSGLEADRIEVQDAREQLRQYQSKQPK